MVIDTSALVAILLREPEADAFLTLIAEAPHRFISAPTYLEAVMVLTGRLSTGARTTLDRFVGGAAIEIMPFTPSHADLAAEAFARFGKGQRHSARLNFGDCFSYALARDLDLPLLFKGDDFAATDIQRAAQP